MNVISLKDVSKKYILSHKKHTFVVFESKKDEEFFAVKSINLNIKKGECIGIIGSNGSGKTTLLKLMLGIIAPTKGRAIVKGKILSFLELGAGFQDELSGKENIYLYGSIIGLSRIEISQKLDEIIEFSQLDRFLDIKLKSYSSGMKVRLAFATAIACNSDILLIDEVLSVGDEEFQKKSLTKIKALKKIGKTIVFVSHNLGQIKEICDKAVYLKGGKIIAQGKVETIVTRYLNDISNTNNYNINLIKKDMSNLRVLESKIEDFTKRVIPKALFGKSLLNNKLKENKNKADLLKEDILNHIVYAKSLLIKDMDTLEERISKENKEEYKRKIIPIIDNLINVIKYEIILVNEIESKVKLLNEIRPFLDKKLAYTTTIKEKAETYRETLVVLLENIKLNQNIYRRSLLLQDFINISPSFDMISSNKKEVIFREMEKIANSIELPGKFYFKDLSDLRFVYDTLCIKYQFSKTEKESILASIFKMKEGLLESYNEKRGDRKFIIEFILDELNERINSKGFDIILKSYLIKMFLEILKKSRFKLENIHLDIIEHATSSLFSQIDQHSIKLKQSKNKILAEKLNELNLIKKNIFELKSSLIRKIAGKNNKIVRILDVWCTNEEGNKKDLFETNSLLAINISYKAYKPVKNPVFGIAIFSDDGFCITGPNTKFHKFKIDEIKSSGQVKYVIKKLILLEGTYYISVAVHPYNSFLPYDHHDKLYSFNVKTKDIKDYGKIYLESQWEHISDK